MQPGKPVPTLKTNPELFVKRSDAVKKGEERRKAAALTRRTQQREKQRATVRNAALRLAAEGPSMRIESEEGAPSSSGLLVGEDYEDGADASSYLIPPSGAAGNGAVIGAPATQYTGIGNEYRLATTRAILRMFARSDFKHDFGEKDVGRDLVTKADRPRFQEMVQLFPVKQRVAMLNEFDKLLAEWGGSVNLHQLLAENIANKLFPEVDVTGPEQKEVDVMADMGIDFEGEVKQHIKNHFPGVGAGNKGPHEAEYEFKPQGGYGGAANARNYIVRAQKYKINTGGSEQTRNLSSLFKDVTGGATKFALLVDAATGLSLTSVLNGTLPVREAITEPCSFIMLQNIESDADSASGVSDFRPTPGATPIPDFKIMRDVDTSTSVFPMWPTSEEESKTEAENLFTKIKIILNRVEKGEVEASVLMGSQTYNFPDVGKASNVKNASLNALAARFAAKILSAATEETEPKQYIYALLKRMGDWCQALSLLDRTRTYRSVSIKTGTPLEPRYEATLAQLVTEGYEIGVVTNDRILLAFAIFLGLNVYYTTAVDVACLVYFKNQDDLPNVSDVHTRSIGLFSDFVGEYGPEEETDGGAGESTYSGLEALYSRYAATLTVPVFETIKAAVRTRIPFVGVDPAIQSGIVAALASKVVLSNLGELRTSLGDFKTKINDAITKYNSIPHEAVDEVRVRAKFNAVKDLWSLVAKLKTDVEHNESIQAQMNAGGYSKPKENPYTVFGEFAKKMNLGARVTTSEALVRAKDILLSERDDVKQILQKTFTLPGGSTLRTKIVSYIPAVPTVATDGRRPRPRDVENFEALYAAFDSVRDEIGEVAGGGKQRGGLRGNLVSLLKQREVFPYPTGKSLERTVNELNQTIEAASEGAATTASIEEAAARAQEKLNKLENLPLVKLHSRVRDEKMHSYSIVDKYLITKDDLHVMVNLIEDIISSTATQAIVDAQLPVAKFDFVVYRYLLLYHDILYNRFERLNDETGAEVYFDEDENVQKVNVNTDYTEGFKEGTESIAAEVGFLRILTIKISELLPPVGPRNLGEIKAMLSIVEDIRKNGRSIYELFGWANSREVTGAQRATIDAIVGASGFEATRLEVAPIVDASGFEAARRATAVTLKNIFDGIVAKYRRIPVDILLPEPLPPGPPMETEEEAAARAAAIRAEEAVPPAAVDSILLTQPLVIIPGLLAAPGALAASIGTGEPPKALGGGLEGGDATTSNVETPSGSVLPGGRRRLYEGLRKRSG
jgi:hypothetical protein